MRQTPSDHSVLIGHGICLALLFWADQERVLSGGAGDVGVSAFRQAVPMPNCAVFTVNARREICKKTMCYCRKISAVVELNRGKFKN
jgi:hypothetical protein